MSSPSNSILSLPPFRDTPTSRFQSLYSDISRQKHSNPTLFHAAVDWWGRVLESIVSSGFQEHSSDRNGSKLVLTVNRGLIDKVRVEGVGKPLGLLAVIVSLSKNELQHTKALFPLSEFLSSKVSVYDPGWLPARLAAFLVGKPLWWALEQLGIVGEDGGSASTTNGTPRFEEYVVLTLVEKAAAAIVSKQRNQHHGPGDVLYTTETFRKEFAHVLGGDELGEQDLKVLLRFLERDRKVLVFDKEQNAIKFFDANASAEARKINAVDKGILELRTAIQNMHLQLDSIQSKIDESTKKATSALRQKRKPVALGYLAHKKQLEELLTQRLSSLQVLQSTLIRVEAAAEDVEIMKLYESSTVTLRAVLAHPSLQRDKIDETMEAMADATADAQDVDNAIREGGMIAGNDIDEGALEAELKALVEEIEGSRTEDKLKVLASDDMKTPTGIAQGRVAEAPLVY